jgi:hypothetical protein
MPMIRDQHEILELGRITYVPKMVEICRLWELGSTDR